MIYYREMTQGKTSHRKRHTRQACERSKCRASDHPILMESSIALPSSQTQVWQYRVLPTRDTHLNLWCPEFLMGLDCILPLRLTFSLHPFPEGELIPVVSSSSGGWKWYNMAKGPRQRYSLLGGTFQRLRYHIPVTTGKGQTSLWVKLIFHYT